MVGLLLEGLDLQVVLMAVVAHEGVKDPKQRIRLDCLFLIFSHHEL
jgi:hypothetical protein